MENLSSKPKRVFLEYIDGEDRIVSGYFDLIEQTQFHIKFRTGNNLVTLSINRLLKMKESL